jgi:DNA repair protein RadC
MIPNDQRPPTNGCRPRALRPREQLAERGASRLGSCDLLALLIGSGRRGESAEQLALRLVRRHGSKGLARLDHEGWLRQRGVGPALAARLVAAFELGRRAHESADLAPPRLDGPRQAFRQVRALCRSRKEQLVGLYLDAQNGLIHRETISVGSLNTTRSHPREILYPAVRHLALGFILAHNHPSGCLEPSAEDVDFTRAVQRAGELIGIELYDHLIVGRGGYTSLRERGMV